MLERSRSYSYAMSLRPRHAASLEYLHRGIECRIILFESMKVATYNVNSIRQRLPIVLAWITEHKPDVMCLQETKVQDQDFPVEAIRDAGYHSTYRGMKGYNGVATLSRIPPERVVYG